MTKRTDTLSHRLRIYRPRFVRIDGQLVQVVESEPGIHPSWDYRLPERYQG